MAQRMSKPRRNKTSLYTYLINFVQSFGLDDSINECTSDTGEEFYGLSMAVMDVRQVR